MKESIGDKKKEKGKNVEHRYVGCRCGNVVRYRGGINDAGRCPQCGECLWEGEPTGIKDWKRAHNIKVVKRNVATLTGDSFLTE